jgi:uncharacterized delta-60 repeat protein
VSLMDRRARRCARPLVAVTVLVLAGFAATAASSSEGGALDPSFDGDGVVVTDFSPADSGQDVLVAPDGRLVVAGGMQTPVGDGLLTGFALARYRPDGSLDATFGTAGKVVTTEADAGEAMAVARQPDGRYVVAGYGFPGLGTDFQLARYGDDGRLDRTFGGGVVSVDLRRHDGAYAVLLRPDGRVVAVGSTLAANGDAADVALVGLTADGALDSSFGGDGTVVADFGGHDTVTGAALQRDGSIVVVGGINSGEGGRVAVARFAADGTLDASFDGDGVASPDLPAIVNEVAGDVAIQPDGRPVVAVSGDGDLTALRLLPDGRLDRSFGTGGIARLATEPPESASALTLQPNGKVVIVGRLLAPHPDGDDFAVARLLPDGRADRHFGDEGVTVTDMGADDDASAVAVQRDGRIVVAGTAWSARFQADVVLARHGGGTCSVPNVRGLAPARAKARVLAGNCRVGRVTRAFSTRVRAGRVGAQRPRAGRELPDWARVDLVVSRGARRASPRG